MSQTPASVTPPATALVQSGGAARGAYEAGVAQYIFEDIAREVGPVSLPILCGTSAGAINVAFLAAHADHPALAAARLVAVWRSLRVTDVVRPSACEAIAIAAGLLGHPMRGEGGGLLDPSGIAHLVDDIPFARIEEHLAAGRLRGVTISTTHVATGETVVFLAHGARARSATLIDASVRMRDAHLGRAHVLASSAIPLLLPPVDIEGELFCDGGLRQNVPFSPAIHLGATALIVVNPQAPSAASATHPPAQAPSPIFILGKLINALTLDRIDGDIDRLTKLNELIAAGTRRYGDGFANELGVSLRPVRVVQVHASQDLGRIAGDYVRSPDFHARGLLERALRVLAEGTGSPSADLVSYLLFDGGYAERLIDLGRHDARAHHDELCALLTPTAA